MNEKLKACIRLVDDLAERKKYNLRPTPERRSREKEKENRDTLKGLPDINELDEPLDLEDFDLPEFFSEQNNELEDEEFKELVQRYNRLLGRNTPPATPYATPPLSPNIIPIPDLNMTTTAIVTSAARFVGKESSTDPEKKKREYYDVERYLADVDSRIAARKLVEDADKIKEALLLVDSEHGDAHRLMTQSIFTKLKTYDEFKLQCRQIWKPKAFKDKLYNLQQLRTIKRKGTTEFGFIADVQTIIDRVVSDVKDGSKVKVEKGGERNEMVDLTEITTYFAFSTIYDSLSEEHQRAFKKIKLDPKVGLVNLMDSIMEKANETRLKQEVVACTENHLPSANDKVEKTLVTQQSNKNNQGKKGNFQRG